MEFAFYCDPAWQAERLAVESRAFLACGPPSPPARTKKQIFALTRVGGFGGGTPGSRDFNRQALGARRVTNGIAKPHQPPALHKEGKGNT
jgi:hypothetical protein